MKSGLDFYVSDYGFRKTDELVHTASKTAYTADDFFERA
jgi:hypothetical protein